MKEIYRDTETGDPVLIAEGVRIIHTYGTILNPRDRTGVVNAHESMSDEDIEELLRKARSCILYR